MKSCFQRLCSHFFLKCIFISALISAVNTKAQMNDSLNSIVADSLISSESKIKNHVQYLPDTVYLRNGDQITGKILSFEQGRLSIDGQGPGVVSLKWHKISSIRGGNRIFKVEDIKGITYIGKIGFSKDTGEVLIKSVITYGVMLENIVRVFPLEDDWYRGLKGDLSAGVSYSKSSDVLQINGDYKIYYVISKWRFINNASFISTTVGDDPASLRMQFNLQALYALPQRWVLAEMNSYNRNDELGIKARISIMVGGGNNIIQTDRQRLMLLSGIVQNSERDVESNNITSNFEWPFSVQHTIYSFLKPNLSSTTMLTSYVGITEKDRLRFDASTDVTWEFIKNVKLKLSFYYNYDNKILEGKLSTSDYGTVLSLNVQLK